MLLTDTHHPNLGVTTALRMTSAAPSYFPPKVVAGEEYVDGGVGNNNPLMLFLRHFVLPPPLHPDVAPVFVSIGTGCYGGDANPSMNYLVSSPSLFVL
eukprot:m.145358 g.145358  ORF g.145358 m.145358 type:complete len:98 (-) comp24274_c0_seq3:99-392(-)